MSTGEKKVALLIKVTCQSGRTMELVSCTIGVTNLLMQFVVCILQSGTKKLPSSYCGINLATVIYWWTLA